MPLPPNCPISHVSSLHSSLSSLSHPRSAPTCFDAVSVPDMTVHCYLVRLRRYTKFDSVCFLVAVAYIGRLVACAGPSFAVTVHNVHRLLITAILVASKASDDTYHANAFMAQCGGITVHEVSP